MILLCKLSKKYMGMINLSSLQQRLKRFSLNYRDLMNDVRVPPQQKRFSMNYQDFLNGQQEGSVTPKDKRFSMNMQDFLRQQRRQGDGRMAKKRFTIVRDLDTLAVPVSGYWDLAPQQPDQG